MRQLRILTIFVIIIMSATSAFGLQMGKSAPKIKIYRHSPTQVVVYDARPEMAINADITKKNCEVLNTLGIRLVRCQLAWNLMETTDKPGLYDSKYLAQFDTMIEECRKAGIYVDVVISGDPPGVTYANRKQAYERLAQFVSDMARRYPPALYWELFSTNIDGTCLFGEKDNISPREQGKNYSEMLKLVSPAIKASNPFAWIVCCAQNGDNEFTRGIYDGGGKDYFDIMNIHVKQRPLDAAFVSSGASMRVIMNEYGDEGKPVWNTELGSITQENIDRRNEEYVSCFDKNNDLYLCEKLFIMPYLPADLDDSNPSLTYKWLIDGQLNKSIAGNSRTTTKVFVATKQPMIPIGYDYNNVEGGIEILRVVVDNLVPTRINLMYISEPQALKPGQQPAPKKPKNSRPIPDPFDP